MPIQLWAKCARSGPLIFHPPIVLSTTVGMGNEATTFFKRLASLLAEYWDSHYGSPLCWLRCRLGFSLLRSAIQAIRGTRSSRGPAAVPHITACHQPHHFRIRPSQRQLNEPLYMHVSQYFLLWFIKYFILTWIYLFFSCSGNELRMRKLRSTLHCGSL